MVRVRVRVRVRVSSPWVSRATVFHARRVDCATRSSPARLQMHSSWLSTWLGLGLGLGLGVRVRVRVRVTDAQLVAQHLRRQWVDGWGRGEWMVEGRVRKG